MGVIFSSKLSLILRTHAARVHVSVLHFLTRYEVFLFLSLKPSLTDLYTQFSLSPDPRLWGSDLSPDLVEPDDDLHNPELDLDRLDGKKKELKLTSRGIVNVGCILVLLLGLISLL